MANINGSLASFSPLQAQALKGTFIEQAGDNTFSGTNTFTGANTFSSTLTATGTTQINTLKVGTSGTVGAFNIYPATSARGSLRFLAANSAGDTVTTITNASQAGAITYTIPDAGTAASFVMTEGAQTLNGTKTIPAIVTTNIDAGASGTAGTVDIFPTTASTGKMAFVAASNAGDTTTTFTNASQAGVRTYTVPDAGASASFVMTEGAQTVNGAKTFGGAGVFSSTLASTGIYTPTGGVAAAGGFSAAPRMIASQGIPARLSTDGNNSTPSTTETYITPIFVPCNMTITGVKVFNGTDVTGNIRVGLANAVTGAPIAAALTASTAGSGTDAYQTIPFAAPYAAVGPANYLVCVQYDSATARYNTHTIGTDPCIVQTGTTYGTIPTISPLPTAFVTNVGNIMSLY